MAFGTLHTLDDLVQVQDSIASFGEDALAARVNQALQIYNAAMAEAVEDFAVLTSDYQLPYGVADNLEMQELDQFGSPDASKPGAGGSVGLPLRFYGVAVQWTRHFQLNTSVATLARLMDSAAAEDRKNVVRRIRQRLTNPVNTTGYRDVLQTKNTYTLHALLNADSMDIPNGPNGETFDGSSHTHFLAEASFSEAGLGAAMDTVVEHGVTGSIVIYINRAQEEAMRGFDGFTPYVDSRIVPATTADVARGDFDVNNPADRAIGLFEGAEVQVKPWVPTNYQIVFDRGAGDDKALAIRTRSGAMVGDAYQGGFGQLYDDELHPLRATALGREFGVGTNQRHKAAVNYSGGETYVAPSF